MHYFIDGYNLLFRVLKSGDNLKLKRDEITTNLETKTDLLKLNCTLVFDSHYQEGDSIRSHYKSLEIVFTATGQTADEYILTELKHAKTPSQHTVITSDKVLARLCRARLGKTESVEEFLLWLNKRHKNKLKTPSIENSEQPTKSIPLPLRPLIPLKQESTTKKTQEKSLTPITPIDSTIHRRLVGDDFSYYLSTFEEGSKKIEDVTPTKQKLKKKSVSNKKRSSSIPKSKDEGFISDTERWQHLFENK